MGRTVQHTKREAIRTYDDKMWVVFPRSGSLDGNVKTFVDLFRGTPRGGLLGIQRDQISFVLGLCVEYDLASVARMVYR